MRTIARVTSVEPLDGLTLRVRFSDGLERDLDLEPMVAAGVLFELRDPVMFCEVAVDPIAGTLVWPGGVDLDPDVLHGDESPMSGLGPVVVSERRV